MEKQTEHAEGLDAVLRRVRAAQEAFSTYTQEDVDRIFLAAAAAANRARIPLAKLAAEETGMGIWEDKVIKNHYAAEYVCNAYRDTKTCGVVEENAEEGILKLAEPVGVVAAVIPTTNPTSTVIFKALLALKTRNGMLFSPHPRAKKSTIAAAKLMLSAAEEAGAPAGILGWIDEPSQEKTRELMREADLILATGGPAMVRAAYSSGRPAIGVGAGNTPAVIDESAEIGLAVNSILHSKTFDHGVICASEQAVIVHAGVYEAVREEFCARGGYFLSEEEKTAVRRTMFRDGVLNAEIVGKSAVRVAELCGLSVPEETKVLIGEVEGIGREEAFSAEKLSPVLAMYRAADFEEALERAEALIRFGGMGHTAAIYLNEEREKEKLRAFSHRMRACRILVNTPASQGGIGDLYNFALPPSLTLGCGSWGGNSVSENVGVKHLLNLKTVAMRRENMLWFRAPEKVFLKRGCLGKALEELSGKKRIFIVTDRYLSQSGKVCILTAHLERMGLRYRIFSAVDPDPSLSCARAGAKEMEEFAPDGIVAFGGGSAMDAAKIMWVLYEHPEVDFRDMAMRFADIRKRIYRFPQMGTRADFIAVPTTAGTGSEVTPFAVICEDESGGKYPLADYALMPTMAIVDSSLMEHAPRNLCAAAGIDAVTHALEAYASMMATDFTDGLAMRALGLIFSYLPRVCEDSGDRLACEKTAHAATMAGMAFANAFLGICHSMAHKLGAFYHLPHGVANALLIGAVMRFNASSQPRKMGTFPQYTHPHMLERYAELADYLGISGDSTEAKFAALLAAVEELKGRLGIKRSIREYGVEEKEFLERLDALCEEAFDDQCTGANPRYPLVEELREIYLEAYYGE